MMTIIHLLSTGLIYGLLFYDDQSKLRLPGSKVALMAEDGKVVDSRITDQDAAAEFNVAPRTKYQLLAENNSYIPRQRKYRLKARCSILCNRKISTSSRAFLI